MLRGFPPSRKALVISVACLAIVVVAYLGLQGGRSSAPELAFTQLLSKVERGEVRSVLVQPEGLVVQLTNGTEVRSVAPAGYVAAPALG